MRRCCHFQSGELLTRTFLKETARAFFKDLFHVTSRFYFILTTSRELRSVSAWLALSAWPVLLKGSIRRNGCSSLLTDRFRSVQNTPLLYKKIRYILIIASNYFLSFFFYFESWYSYISVFNSYSLVFLR